MIIKISEKKLEPNINLIKYRFKNSNIEIIKAKKKSFKIKLILDKETVSNIVKKNKATLGINGGFYDTETFLPIFRFKNENYTNKNYKNKNYKLPIISIDTKGEAKIIENVKTYPKIYFETGPLLLHKGKIKKEYNFFKENEIYFDEYINKNRNPRSIFGTNNNYYFLITVDGRTKESEGLFLEEVTEFILKLKTINNAINLDGGSSSTLVYKNKIINKPSGNSKIKFNTERIISHALILKYK